MPMLMLMLMLMSRNNLQPKLGIDSKWDGGHRGQGSCMNLGLSIVSCTHSCSSHQHHVSTWPCGHLHPHKWQSCPQTRLLSPGEEALSCDSGLCNYESLCDKPNGCNYHWEGALELPHALHPDRGPLRHHFHGSGNRPSVGPPGRCLARAKWAPNGCRAGRQESSSNRAFVGKYGQTWTRAPHNRGDTLPTPPESHSSWLLWRRSIWAI